eukprot:8914735-Pyramimonas_sp.AAC.1
MRVGLCVGLRVGLRVGSVPFRVWGTPLRRYTSRSIGIASANNWVPRVCSGCVKPNTRSDADVQARQHERVPLRHPLGTPWAPPGHPLGTPWAHPGHPLGTPSAPANNLLTSRPRRRGARSRRASP